MKILLSDKNKSLDQMSRGLMIRFCRTAKPSFPDFSNGLPVVKILGILPWRGSIGMKWSV